MTRDVQADIAAAAPVVATQMYEANAGLGACTEDGDFRPMLIDALRARDFNCDGFIHTLPTAARPHPFDLVWEREGINGAIELKLPVGKRGAPPDDSRLSFWYDVKWLELGIEAGHFEHGTALLLTDLRQLVDDSTGSDMRHEHYRIGRHHAHRCGANGPDHLFDYRYKSTKFIRELYPLHIRGCYDFRERWRTIPDCVERPVYLLSVPVTA
jgi:hypothetical protein